MGSMDAWSNHLRGAAGLVRLRGRDQFRRLAGRKMFARLRSDIVSLLWAIFLRLPADAIVFLIADLF